MREALRVFRIGMIRLLAPEVSCSISAVDMNGWDGFFPYHREIIATHRYGIKGRTAREREERGKGGKINAPGLCIYRL